MNTPANIIAFQQLLRARFPEAHALQQVPEKAVKTGIACLDAAGLSAGTLCEVVAAGGATGAGLLLATLVEGSGEVTRQPVALVDGADAFDPRTVSSEALTRLLWLRCRDSESAIRAADLLLRDGNIPRVLLDLQLCTARHVRQIPAHAWHRLRLQAEKSGVALCVFTAFQAVPCARSRLLLEPVYSLDSLEVLRPKLLSGLQGRVTRRSASVFDGAQLAVAV